MLRRASRLVPGRSNPDGTPFLCAEVKATLSDQDVGSALEKQLFPYMDLSRAPYGALVSSRTGTDGVVTLDTHLVDRSLTGVPRAAPKHRATQRLGSFDSALPHET